MIECGAAAVTDYTEGTANEVAVINGRQNETANEISKLRTTFCVPTMLLLLYGGSAATAA